VTILCINGLWLIPTTILIRCRCHALKPAVEELTREAEHRKHLSASRQGKLLSCELENEVFGGQWVPVLAFFTN
jgi:hypothetical protein